jgi:hypothetical protein
MMSWPTAFGHGGARASLSALQSSPREAGGSSVRDAKENDVGCKGEKKKHETRLGLLETGKDGR